MKISVLGTGMVGRAHAAKLAELGHEVMIGSHDVTKALTNTANDSMGNAPFVTWSGSHQSIKVVTYAEAAQHGEVIIDALKGEIAVEVLKSLETELATKILVDIANPLDFSQGMPPTLTICNTDSLGEQIQRALLQVIVVKTLNTMNAELQVNPQLLADGDHSIFMSGNDQEAKQKVRALLAAYGWRDIIDLGDISTARGTEMLLPIWLRLWGALKTPMFNFKVTVQS